MINLMKGNSIMSLDLYNVSGTWCFDDEKFDISREPFVMGMSEIISSYLPENADTCQIIFSLYPFPNADVIKLEKEESNGGWYNLASKNMRGWLCPVTRVYMKGIPDEIYFHVVDTNEWAERPKEFHQAV